MVKFTTSKNRKEKVQLCPGSDKSTLAKSLNDGSNDQIYSTDEYIFDPSELDDAHRYNHRLASEALKQNISPIIIDNTNTTSWEMKPYVEMGKEAGYDILLIEPQTPWRYKASELVKRNLHNLPLRRIREMLNHFEHNVSVQSIIEQTKTNIFFLLNKFLINIKQIMNPQTQYEHQKNSMILLKIQIYLMMFVMV